MYELIDVIASQMDRNIFLKNTITGTVDRCFDYSMMVSNDNFEFMKIGIEYNCKIMLFGEVVNESTEGAQKVLVVTDEIQQVGNTEFIKVRIGADEYYVFSDDVDLKQNQKFFFYRFSRKDLIEVDGKVNHDFD